jgi:hypothetical protein
MLFTLILQAITGILDWYVKLIPTTNVLPFGIDDYLITGMGYIRFITVFFPPLGTLITAFLVYLGFILSLRLAKIIPIIGRIIK